MTLMAERIRYYLDEHVNHAIARGLTLRGVDVLTTVAAGFVEATDLEHLEFAKFAGRVIVSQDADFLRLHATGIEHAGIIYAPQQTDVGSLLAGLLLVHDVLSPTEMQNHVEFV